MNASPHEDWEPDDGPLPDDTVCISASSLADVISKPQLEDWRAREGALRIDEEWEMLSELRQTSPDMARQWMESAPYHQHRDKLNARDRGTVIHSHFESWFGGPPPPPTPEYLHPMIAQLATWVDTSGFQPQHLERVVYLPTRLPDNGPPVAGRIDIAGHVPCLPAPYDGLALLDIKTSEQDVSGSRKRRPYPTVLLQQAVYFYSEWMLTTPARVLDKGRTRLYCVSPQEHDLAEPAPSFAWAGILYVTPNRCTLYPLDLPNGAHLEASLAAARLYWWQSSVKGYIKPAAMETHA